MEIIGFAFILGVASWLHDRQINGQFFAPHPCLWCTDAVVWRRNDWVHLGSGLIEAPTTHCPTLPHPACPDRGGMLS